MQVSFADFLAEILLRLLRRVPKIFDKQNDLRREWTGCLTGFGKGIAYKQTKRVGFHAVLDETGTRLAFVNQRHLLRGVSQMRGDRAENARDFLFGHGEQPSPNI